MGLIKLSQKQEIILKYYWEGSSQRSIARETGIDRKTIKKYIDSYQIARKKLINSRIASSADRIDLIADMVEIPKYQSDNRNKRKPTENMIERIKFHLQENENKKQNGQGKQQKKIIDIHQSLLAEGHEIGYTTVRNTVDTLRKSGKEAFIRIDYAPGDVCEFDWGEVKIYIGDQLKIFQMAIFTSAYSNYRYARLFPKQKMECFIEAHAAFFEHIGGVYHSLVYDNMKVAVKKFVGRYEKEPTEGLLKMSIYYGFSFRFCNARSGNEKGHVEKSVDFIRRKAFCDIDHFDDLEHANRHLLSTCEKLNQTVVAENEFLLPAMPIYEASRYESSRVDKYSTICIDSCHYSVPDCYVGKILSTKVYSTHIRCFHGEVLIAEHPRKYGHQEWAIDISHYCRTFIKKPGALAHSVALKQADLRLRNIYNNFYQGKEKSFIELLLFSKEYTIERIEDAIDLIKKITPTDVTTEKIKVICQRETTNPAIIMASSEIIEKSQDHLVEYSALLSCPVEEFSVEAAII